MHWHNRWVMLLITGEHSLNVICNCLRPLFFNMLVKLAFFAGDKLVIVPSSKSFSCLSNYLEA